MTKTDAEFIAECEAYIKEETKHGYYGEPPMLAEAIERLRVKLYTDYEDITDRVALSGAKADIEELKSLLRWLWNQITEQTLLDLVLVKRGDGPDPVDVRREADGAEQIVDCPEKVRIMELIGIEKEST